MLIYFFDSASSIGCRVKSAWLEPGPVCAASDGLVEQSRAYLEAWRRSGDAAAFDKGILALLLGGQNAGSATREPDPRIVSALAWLDAQESVGHDAVDAMAAQACLSKSRLSHLFTQQMGTSLHRYLAFAKMKKAAEYISDGATLTDAAIRAGFDSPSHFSSTVKRMFGINLTEVMRSMQPR